jgi:hypothetical protein
MPSRPSRKSRPHRRSPRATDRTAETRIARGASRRRPHEYLRTAIGPEGWVSDLSDLSAPPSILSRYPAGGPWREFPQFPLALCQLRGPARACHGPDPGITAISASDMPINGSGRPGILSHRMEVGISTSGAAACGVAEQWRCERLSRRASMLPILSRWARQTYATTLLRNVKDETCAMAAVRARKIILSYRRGASRNRLHALPAFGCFVPPDTGG